MKRRFKVTTTIEMDPNGAIKPSEEEARSIVQRALGYALMAPEFKFQDIAAFTGYRVEDRTWSRLSPQ